MCNFVLIKVVNIIIINIVIINIVNKLIMTLTKLWLDKMSVYNNYVQLRATILIFILVNISISIRGLFPPGTAEMSRRVPSFENERLFQRVQYFPREIHPVDKYRPAV